MNYEIFLEYADEGPRLTSTPDFMPPETESDQPTTRPDLFDLRFTVAKDTRTPAPLALEVAERNFGEWYVALATQWTLETGHIASITRRRQHAAYKNIVKLGDRVVPLLLDSLRTRPDYWFPALRELTGEDPVQEDDRGYYDRMAAAWIKWGRDHHLIV